LQFTNAIYSISKFFGNPNAPKAPPKQSKLSFSSKSTSNGAPSSSAPKENVDVDVEEDVKTEVKPKVKDETLDAKENVKPANGMLYQCRELGIIS
jgi:DNA ligase-1